MWNYTSHRLWARYAYPNRARDKTGHMAQCRTWDTTCDIMSDTTQDIMWDTWDIIQDIMWDNEHRMWDTTWDIMDIKQDCFVCFIA